MDVVGACDYMFPIRFMASLGYPRSFIRIRSLTWSMEPMAFLKCIYIMNMLWFVNFATINTWSCRDVIFSALNLS